MKNKKFLYKNRKCFKEEVFIMASPSQTHGPIVKTGPTAGKNRSRNKDGRWRKKRSDTGKKRKD